MVVESFGFAVFIYHRLGSFSCVRDPASAGCQGSAGGVYGAAVCDDDDDDDGTPHQSIVHAALDSSALLFSVPLAPWRRWRI